jgi:hypothetical protein
MHFIKIITQYIIGLNPFTQIAQYFNKILYCLFKFKKQVKYNIPYFPTEYNSVLEEIDKIVKTSINVTVIHICRQYIVNISLIFGTITKIITLLDDNNVYNVNYSSLLIKISIFKYLDSLEEYLDNLHISKHILIEKIKEDKNNLPNINIVELANSINNLESYITNKIDTLTMQLYISINKLKLFTSLGGFNSTDSTDSTGSSELTLFKNNIKELKNELINIMEMNNDENIRKQEELLINNTSVCELKVLIDQWRNENKNLV